MHGPAMNPNRCPTALEGDSGTVHGLTRTKNNPDNDKTVPIFFISYDDFVWENHTPNGINPIGSQNNKAAWSISSMSFGRTAD